MSEELLQRGLDKKIQLPRLVGGIILILEQLHLRL